MSKSVTTVLVVIALALLGTFVVKSQMPDIPSIDDTQNSSARMEGTMPAGEVMNDDDSMVGGDAAVGDSMMESDAMMKVDADADADVTMGNEAMKKADAMMEKSSASYLAFSDGVIGNGQTSVLFFHASWCPSCRQGDKDLASIYGKGTAKISTYKVDYDSETALKQQYGVTYQHTFVLIDGKGNAIKTMQGATAAQLAELVNG